MTQTSKDVERLVAEQEPDASKPYPHCHKPVRDTNIFVEGDEPRLLSHCGGSGFAYSGEGCFATVDPRFHLVNRHPLADGSEEHVGLPLPCAFPIARPRPP